MKPCDILFFDKYFFTDKPQNDGVPHFALLLLPVLASGFTNNIYCAVITSQKPYSKYLKLKKEGHKCFSKDSYVCFDRRDFQSLDDLSKRKKVGTLSTEERKDGFKRLKATLITDNNMDKFLRATIIREWKKHLTA